MLLHDIDAARLRGCAAACERPGSRWLRVARPLRGNGYPSSSYFNFMPVYAPNNSKTVEATQLINTSMTLQNANGNNAAFVSGITTNMNPRIESSNNINVH